MIVKVYVVLNEALESHRGSDILTVPAGVETEVWTCSSEDAARAVEVLAAWARNPRTRSARIERL